VLTCGKIGVLSDQYENWSDSQFAESIHPISSEPARSSRSTSSATICNPARFAYRALQALWQTGLQMRSGAGPWAQVLPLDQSARCQARNGLRPSRRATNRCSVFGKLSRGPRDPGSDLRDQSRVVTSQGDLVEETRVPSKHRNLCCTDRSPPGRRACRQHGRGTIARVPSRFSRGDQQ
jgi:hypothetical protein